MVSSSRSMFAAGILGLCISGLVRAQCTPSWAPGFGVPGADGAVHAIVEWDPDGAGPQPSRVVVGGEFRAIGNAQANRIAMRDPATGQWQQIGPGFQDAVRSLAVLPNGELVAGGSFVVAGGTVVNRVARWDGVAWRAFGAGVDGDCLALLALADGSLVAGGSFVNADGVLANGIARWNGSSWNPYFLGLTTNPIENVTGLGLLPNGRLVAAGRFANASGIAVGSIASWNGSFWEPIGGLGSNTQLGGQVRSLLVAADGSIYVVGTFTSSSGLPSGSLQRVARWNGAWQPLGAGFSDSSSPDVRGITQMPNGDIVVVGFLIGSGSTPLAGVARWNGTSWSQVAGGIQSVGGIPTCARALADGSLMVGGTFLAEGNGVGQRLAVWNGGSFGPIAPGADGAVNKLAVAANGDLIAIGSFTRIGAIAANKVASYDGSVWQDLGQGLQGMVNQVVVDGDGAIVVATSFGLFRRGLNGWQSLPGQSFAQSLLLRGNGRLVAGSQNLVSEWNGTTWTQLGGSGNTPDGSVLALAETASGDLVAGGSFFTAGGQTVRNVARWNGTNWVPMGNGLSGEVRALVRTRDGSIVAGGFVTSSGTSILNVARWDGTSWQPMGAGCNGAVNSLVALPNGDVIAGGGFTASGSLALDRLARWNGTQWLPVPGVGNGEVRGLAHRADGTLFVGGSFTFAGGMAMASVGVQAPACPATVSTYGAGCVGAGGPLALAASTRPWLGSTFRARGTGFPANALALSLYQFVAANLQLWQVLPQGQPGCQLLLDPFGVGIYPALPSQGVVDSLLGVPTNPALLGTTVFHQLLGVELDTFGNIAHITSSNGLALVIGSL